MNLRSLAIVLPILFVAACSKRESDTLAETFKEPDVPAPKTVDEMFAAARGFAAKCTPLELTGPLAKFKGTISQDAVYDAVEAVTDIKDIITSGPKDAAFKDFDSGEAYGLSCPSGRFVLYQMVRKPTYQNWLVGVNVDAKKAAVMAFQNTKLDQAGDIPTLAVMWAYRGFGIQEFYNTGLLTRPTPKLSSAQRQYAIGYLYGAQSNNHDLIRANDAQAKQADSDVTQSTEDKASGVGLIYSGEFITYPKGATEADLRKSYADLNCYRMNGASEDVCIGKSSLGTPPIIRNLPNGGTCLIDKEFTVSMDGEKTGSVACDIASVTADQIATTLDARIGAPRREQVTVSSMRSEHFEWKVGQDYVLLTHFTGQDVRGNNLDNFNLSVGNKPLKLNN